MKHFALDNNELRQTGAGSTWQKITKITAFTQTPYDVINYN